MARYTGPVCRLCRREKMKLFLKGPKCDSMKCPIERRPYPPGDHGRSRRQQGVRKVDVLVKGPGSGRETAIRSLTQAGIEVAGIKDVTPIPHNGCRPKKRRRV